jgi:hypothetical protein
MADDGANWQGTGAVVTISSSGLGSVHILVDGNTFDIDSSTLPDWLNSQGLGGRTIVWTPSSDAHAIAPTPRAGYGFFEWQDFTSPEDADDATRERTQEDRARAWQHVLDAWDAFLQRILELGDASDGAAIIIAARRAIGALAMLELHDWGPPYTAELGAWNAMNGALYTPDSLQAAARAVVAAGNSLVARWHALSGAGNYMSSALLDDQHAFVGACTQARTQLAPVGN